MKQHDLGWVPSGPDDVHTMPIEEPEHLPKSECPCKPKVIYIESASRAKVWLHRHWTDVAILDDLSAALSVGAGEHLA